MPALASFERPHLPDPFESLRTEACCAVFWRDLCPWLHVGDERLRQLAQAATGSFPEGADNVESWSADLIQEGYFSLEAGVIRWAVSVADVARGVDQLVSLGLPPICILAYDEPWVMLAQLSKLVRATTGGNELIMDWAAFFVKAGDGRDLAEAAGWAPHRDRSGFNAALNGFRSDGSPRWTNFWIALTDATPQSSCMMVVPRKWDPGYHDESKGYLQDIFGSVEAYQRIRALPIASGGLLAWSHRLMHWGSAADERAPAPRISLAFATADPSFERPAFSHTMMPMPPLELRVALLAGQVLKNAHNESCLTSRARVSLFFNLFCTMAEVFDREYAAERKDTNTKLHLKLPRMHTLQQCSVQVEESADEDEALLVGLFEALSSSEDLKRAHGSAE